MSLVGTWRTGNETQTSEADTAQALTLKTQAALAYFVRLLIDSMLTGTSFISKPVTLALPHPPFSPEAEKAVLSLQPPHRILTCDGQAVLQDKVHLFRGRGWSLRDGTMTAFDYSAEPYLS